MPYSIERAVDAHWKTLEKNHMGVPHIADCSRKTWCSDLRYAGPDSNVIVYDAATMRIKRVETPQGVVIVRFRGNGGKK